MNLCRCGRDEHQAPLSRTVAGFYDNHSFSESYDPDTDTSDIVCPGTFTEGPLRLDSLPKPGSWSIQVTSDAFSSSLKYWQGVMQQEMLYGSPNTWMPDESLKMTAHTWLPFNDPGVLAAMNPSPGILCNPSYEPQTNGWYHLGKLSDDGIKFASIKHDKANDQYISTTWGGTLAPKITLWDKWFNYVAPKKECAGDPPKITFGPENWVKEPKQCWTSPWIHLYKMELCGIPPLHSPAWKEPIPLPDLPVDYAEVVKQYNEQFSYAGVK